MPYAQLFPNKKAALKAAREYISNIRLDWATTVHKETMSGGFIAPLHRTPEMQKQCFRAFVVESSGSFSRRDDVYRGEASATEMFAYRVDPQGVPEFKRGRSVRTPGYGVRDGHSL